jgi:hypothetical protein
VRRCALCRRACPGPLLVIVAVDNPDTLAQSPPPPPLHTLPSLANNDLGDHGAAAIAPALQRFTALQTLE